MENNQEKKWSKLAIASFVLTLLVPFTYIILNTPLTELFPGISLISLFIPFIPFFVLFLSIWALISIKKYNLRGKVLAIISIIVLSFFALLFLLALNNSIKYGWF